MSAKKVLVGSLPDPPVGVWRCITNPQPDIDCLASWNQGMQDAWNQTEVREISVNGETMYELWARKRA